MSPQTTVAEILASGLTQMELASLVPCSQSAVSSLLTGARGARISKRIGDRLEEIHFERCVKRKSSKRRNRKAASVPGTG
jgi:predicted transcriptional regulator